MSFKANHFGWLTLLCGLIPVLIIGAILSHFIAMSTALLVGLLLLCPLLRVVMMMGLGRHTHGSEHLPDLPVTLTVEK